MFKFKNGYCQVNADDVQRIFEIPNRGREASQSTKDSRIPKPKENRFVDKYFSEMTRIGRIEIAQAIQVAFDAKTTEGDQDAAYLIILYLLNTNLLGSSTGKRPWTLVKNYNSIDKINQHNWATETARYLMESIDITHKRKRDKQPNVSGAVVLLLVSKQKLIKKNQKGETLANNSKVGFGSST
ncbi:hypothetical protein D8674_024371 [Pyrus ussuriensis x Pyrus communis]|uniref:Uncharacterized protein n=1 Tax=Pyrus ussuriensis x Pyrus communis TaxID=2448454 RepID=A0A5N5H2Q4_9ROSA|nr:hypothetical protein D8674_024371 [Pyrus ussuriensis x Pyrus communis]